jgi:hypothetical protein
VTKKVVGVFVRFSCTASTGRDWSTVAGLVIQPSRSCRQAKAELWAADYVRHC